jgi:hypothetical protein
MPGFRGPNNPHFHVSFVIHSLDVLRAQHGTGPDTMGRALSAVSRSPSGPLDESSAAEIRLSEDTICVAADLSTTLTVLATCTTPLWSTTSAASTRASRSM